MLGHGTSDELLVTLPDVDVVEGPGGRALVRRGRRLLEVDGIPPALVGEIARLAAGGTKSVDLQRILAGRWPADAIVAALRALSGVVIAPRREAIAAGGYATMREVVEFPVLVVGSGALAEAIRRRVAELGLLAEVDSRATIDGPAEEPGVQSGSDLPGASDDMHSFLHLPAQPRVLVLAPEHTTYGVLFASVRAAVHRGTPLLLVTGGLGWAEVTPFCVPGVSACPACTEIALRTTGDDPTGTLDAIGPLGVGGPLQASIADHVAARVARVVEKVHAGTQLEGMAASAVVFDAAQEREVLVLRRADCPVCGDTVAPDTDPLRRLALADVGAALSRSWQQPTRRIREARPDAYRTVAVLGGGTAGYLTALALRARLPHLDVTLIESSGIPVIGVGEATTPELVRFLHAPQGLALDIADFFRRVLPTWKLGIRFEWGVPPGEHFTFPFQRGRIMQSLVHAGHLNDQSLGSMLMDTDRGPVLGGDEPLSLLSTLRWAYHLDNPRFVHYLQQEAMRAGVRHVDARVADAELAGDGATVRALLAEDGKRLEYDLYVDCSGFRSVLLGKKLGIRWTSYADSLFTDTAIAANVPHDGRVKCYTLAETMDAGWCWNIPFEDEDHRGYVFSSEFLEPDAAVDEMRRKNPGMHDEWVVRFRSGRHERFWMGNVVAVGNSYGFVEPLESTAIHMIVLQLDLLTRHFPESRHDRAVPKMLNRRLNERWDALRWFLSLHYRFNRRLHTPFWRAARHDTDISGAVERLRLFEERAPLSYSDPLSYHVLPPEFFSDDHSLDTILLGQRVKTRGPAPVESDATWRSQMAALRAVAALALPHGEALHVVREERPDLLTGFVADPDSWIHQWVPA